MTDKTAFASSGGKVGFASGGETTVKKVPRASSVRVRVPRAHTTKKSGDASATSAPRATKAGKAGKGEATHRLRIRVRAYEHGILDSSVKQIIDTATRYNAEIVGPVPLPIDIKKYTVNRAAFIDKDSREQFEMRIHKRMIDILNPAPKVIEALSNIDLPSGVNIDVKMM
jgi:small subunit ribosomal protein S10